MTNYAVEIATGTKVSNSIYGLTGGFFRLITGRPSYSAEVNTLGDNSQFKVTISNGEDYETALASGVLYAAENVGFKTADTAPTEDMVFTSIDNTDTSDGLLLTAKGSALAAGDMFTCATVPVYMGSNVWYEDFILDKGIGNLSRKIDISKTGDYGTLSGVKFTTENAGKVWSYMETNSIFVANKSVKVYAIINNVFYQIWDGVAKNNPRSETGFSFDCADSFRKIHKDLPPKVITSTEFEDAPSDFYGDAIPIAVGDVPHNQVKNVSIKSDITDASPISAYWSESSDGFNYPWVDSNSPTLLFHPFVDGMLGTDINWDTLDVSDGKYYLQFIKGNSDNFNPKEHLMKILYVQGFIGTEAPVMQLEAPLGDLVYSDFKNGDYRYLKADSEAGAPTVNADSWWCKIVKIDFNYLVSNDDITSYYQSDNFPVLETWNKENASYKSINFLVKDAFIDDGGDISYPSVEIATKDISDDGILRYFHPIYLESTDIKPWVDGGRINNYAAAGDSANITDKSRDTYYTISLTGCQYTRGRMPNYTGATFDFSIGDSFENVNIEELYCSFDLSWVANDVSVPLVYKDFVKPIYLKYKISGLDLFGNEVGSDMWVSLLKDIPSGTASADEIFLPDMYYGYQGETGSFTSQFGEWADIDGVGQPYQEAIELNASFVELIKNGAIKTLRIGIALQKKDQPYSPFNYSYDIQFRQIGVVALSEVEALGDNIYTAVKGEQTNANETNNVYRAFQLMMETYDGIGSYAIDYGNLAAFRGDWYVGRQLTERKNSFDYIKELCQQSFVGLAPTRKGHRKLTAWLENTTSTATHDADVIIDGSIKGFKLTPIQNLYNSFDIKYAWNPASKEYDRSFFIHNVDRDVGDFSRTDDIGGYGIESTNPSGDVYWLACQDSYTQVEAEQKAPANLSELDWFIDGELLTTGTIPTGTDSSAWKYLTNFVEWTTHQKKTVAYKIPLTVANLQLELLDRITFNDVIYTNSTDEGGWITKIKVDPKKNEIEITLTLEPVSVYDTGLIVERGALTGDDTITERGAITGAGDDTITEGA